MKHKSFKPFLILTAGLSISIFVFSQSGIIFVPNQPTHSERRLEIDDFHQTNDYQNDLKKISSLTDSRDLKGLIRFSEEIEKYWANDSLKRSSLLAEISNSLSSYDFSDNLQYKHSVKLAKNILRDADALPIQLEFEMVSKLLSTTSYSSGIEPSDRWESERSKRMKLVIHLWNRIQESFDPTFDTSDIRNQPLGNIAVPGGKYPSGVNPQVIKESEIKEKYMASLAANKAKADKLNFQIQIRRMKEQIPSFLEKVLTDFYSLDPKNPKELEKNIRMFKLDQKTRQRILDTTKNT